AATPLGPMGKLNAEVAYKQEGLEGGLEQLSFTSKFGYEKPKDGGTPGLTFKVNKAEAKTAESKGTIKFDAGKGRLAERAETARVAVKLSVEAQGQEIEMDLRMEIKSAHKVADARPGN